MISIEATGNTKDNWNSVLFDLYETKDIPLLIYKIRKFLEENEIAEIKIILNRTEDDQPT